MADVPETISNNMQTVALPPHLMMWAGMYTVMFCIAGGMIAYLYKPD